MGDLGRPEVDARKVSISAAKLQADKVKATQQLGLLPVGNPGGARIGGVHFRVPGASRWIRGLLQGWPFRGKCVATLSGAYSRRRAHGLTRRCSEPLAAPRSRFR